MATIETAFVKQFGSNVELLVQQKGSRLRNAVRVETGIVGEEAYFDQLSATEAVKRTTRHADTPLVNSDWARRRVTMYDYEWADLIDKQDKLKMLADPESTYVMNAANAMGRAMDDEIIAAINGTAYTGKAGGTSTTLPSAQKVAVGTTGLTLTKLLAAKEVLDGADVDPDEEKYCVATAEQMTDLLNTTEIKSSDYNSVRALVTGQVDSFLGFKFILSNRLAVDGSDSRLIPVFAKSGVLLAVAEEMVTRITERDDKSYAAQPYVKMGIGSTRMEEAKVVQIACSEA